MKKVEDIRRMVQRVMRLCEELRKIEKMLHLRCRKSLLP